MKWINIIVKRNRLGELHYDCDKIQDGNLFNTKKKRKKNIRKISKIKSIFVLL